MEDNKNEDFFQEESRTDSEEINISGQDKTSSVNDMPHKINSNAKPQSAVNKKKIVYYGCPLHKIPFAVLLILSSACAAMYTLVMLFHYEPSTGLFSAKSALPTIFIALISLSVLLVGIWMLLLKEKHEPKYIPTPNIGIIFTSALTGFVLLGRALVYFTEYKNYTQDENIKKWVVFFAAIFSVGAAVYFIRTAVSRSPYNRKGAAWGFFPVLCSAAHILQIYFSNDRMLRSPVEVIRQMAYIACMLYFLMELRYLIRRPKPRLYFACAYIAFILSVSASLPAIIIMIKSNTVDISYQTPNIILLTFSAYILCRIISFFRCTCKSKPDNESITKNNVAQ